MATDFAVFLRRFLTTHLAGLRGYSPNTIVSYRDAFKLLICYFRDERSTPPEKLTPRGLATYDDRTDRAAILVEHVRHLVDAAPPLSAEQIEQLRGLLPAPTTNASSPSAAAPKPATHKTIPA